MKTSYFLGITIGDNLYLFDPTRYSPELLRSVHGREAYSGQFIFEDMPIITQTGLRPQISELVYGRNGKAYIVQSNDNMRF